MTPTRANIVGPPFTIGARYTGLMWETLMQMASAAHGGADGGSN
ncbi:MULTISPECIES: hypothetical protein [Bradyrhizobium]|nr:MULTISPECIES: hypothetical protein [Bradyrhizobium]MCP1774879.1 hypothetical protein [Bradyrhizobium japonicum]MCP1962120.1 hypothetical protein [Bradyrhizobium japonicum]MDI2074326.1 hypothetical protein [Bradyrhizobium sp. Mp27]